MKKALFILSILVIAFWLAAYAEGAKELPLEVSEKYYKKEAILEFNKAVSSWESGDVDKAITFWKKALEIDPILWVSYLGLGQAYEKKEEFSKSLESYKQYLKLAPSGAKDKDAVKKSIDYLSHLLRHGEKAIQGDDYLSLVQTKHEGRDLYVRFELNNPLNIYFVPPAKDGSDYPKEYENAFVEGANIWTEVLTKLKFKVLDNSEIRKLPPQKAKKKEKEILENTQIKVVFPSKITIKGKPESKLAQGLDAYSYPIIRDKKNFRVLGKIMISPYIYFQAQIAIPLEPLAGLSKEEQYKKVKLIAAKEVGHALGLWGFSPNPKDFMFEGEVTEIKLSERDKNTIQSLYKLNPEEKEVLTNK